MDKLTPEQQTLVEKNIRLVHHAIKRYFPFLYGGKEYEDWVQIGCIGLCNAARGYDPDTKLAFSTLACTAIKHEILHELERMGMRKRRPIAPEQSLQDEADGIGTRLEEILADPRQNVEEKTHASICLQRLKELTEDNPVLFEAVTGQLTNKEAADELNVSHTLIYLRKLDIRNQLKEEGLW